MYLNKFQIYGIPLCPMIIVCPEYSDELKICFSSFGSMFEFFLSSKVVTGESEMA